MRLLSAVLFLAFAGAASAADDPKEAAKKLEGTYEVLEISEDGKPDPKKKEGVTFVIKDGEIIVKEGEGKKNEAVKFTLDPSKTPPHIDIMPRGDKLVQGIYQTKETDKGLELTIAFREGKDAGRPTEFKGAKDTVILKLLRKKAK
jgi:uncharacterized protein (TIGR03067 family)